MSQLHEALLEYFGERCADHDPECAVCQGWAEYDAVVNALQNAVPFIGYEGAGDQKALAGVLRALTLLKGVRHD